MPTVDSPAIEPVNYQFLQQLVYDGSGIVLEHDKAYLFESRLSTVARQHGLGTVNDLCALMRACRGNPVEKQVVEAMTTNETYFFREPAHYDLIRSVLLPELKELRASSRKLSCWSAAASTGQEAYSLAMLLTQEGFAGWNVQIMGTDLSEQVLTRARAGRYMQIEVNRGLPASMLVKHFQRQGLEWVVSEAIRKMARFESRDLRKPLRSLGPFDLVFCRNVLVYFDAPTRRKIIEEIHGTLFRGGWLLLSTTEAQFGIEERFERQVIKGVTVYVAR